MSIAGMICGFIVGDCVGTPAEFVDRQSLRLDPITDMMEYGTHHQPMGVWSDDSSMLWCTVEAILQGYTVEKLAGYFVDWMTEAKFTPNNEVFDIGIGTRVALMKVVSGRYNHVTECGGNSERDNGNGSLMRCPPLIALLRPFNRVQRFRLVQETSSITHAHIRSVMACYYFCHFLLFLESSKNKFKAYESANAELEELFRIQELDIPEKERGVFERILTGNIHLAPEDDIYSTGYVIDSLEAALWVFLTTEDDYRTGVLKAVNLGGDTDTISALTGAILGFHLGAESIPREWLHKVIRIDEILVMAGKFEQLYSTTSATKP